MPVKILRKVLINLLLMCISITCAFSKIPVTAAEGAVPICRSVVEAADLLRQGMERRDSQVHLIYETRADVDERIGQRIYDAALYHTGKPTEGDYLAMTVDTWKMVYSHTVLKLI